MEKIELQEIIDACEKSGSEYINLYRPLLGYEDDITLYRGADDSVMDALTEVETKIGLEFPADFFQVYLLSNGGKYFDIKLFSLTSDKKYVDGIYYQNLVADTRKEYNVPDNMLLIGESTDGVLVLIGLDKDDCYYYALWNKETKEEEMQFDYLPELLMYEIDYYTGTFDVDEEEE